MQIIISEKFPTSLHPIIRGAILLTAGEFGMPGIEKVKVKPLSKKDAKKVAGFSHTKGKTGIIELHAKASALEILDKALHEAVHITQMANGHLEFLEETDGEWRIRWKKLPAMRMQTYEALYDRMPFEKQAYAFSAKIVRQLMAELAKATKIPAKQMARIYDRIPVK
jgi:hypothetical protein